MQEEPSEIETRLRMARLLRDDGQLQKAEDEYSLLHALAPARKDIEAALREITLKIHSETIGK